SINTQGGLLQLTAAILPTNAANKNIIWSISDTNLATITQTGLVTAKANGTIIVTATAADGGGAKATKTITITNQTVGINEVNLNNQITVYPNPASNKLIITTTNNLTPDASGLQLQLLDLTGKVIANYNNQTEIDISAIANGMYLLHIQTPNGNLVKQVVINR
ncbi:MAG: Ig-like domain-containing protein, partial [Candidatus Methylacidiphilales bacterium]